MDIGKILAHFCSADYVADSELPGALPDFDPGATEDFLMKSCLSVAGVCHILHNATRELTNHLAHFSWFYDYFKVCVELLRRREFRKVFCHIGLTGEGAHLLEQKYASFRASLVGHRWGYLLAACQEVASLEFALRLNWDTRRLTGRDLDAGGDRAGVAPVEEVVGNDNIEQAAIFVSSPERWAYLHMIIHLGELVNRLEGLFKSCPCHPSSVFGKGGETWSRRHRAFGRVVMQSVGPLRAGDVSLCCPMQGCQAPSAVAGAHWRLMDEWFVASFLRIGIRVARNSPRCLSGNSDSLT